jgi:hypothetical protein
MLCGGKGLGTQEGVGLVGRGDELVFQVLDGDVDAFEEQVVDLAGEFGAKLLLWRISMRMLLALQSSSVALMFLSAVVMCGIRGP